MISATPSKSRPIFDRHGYSVTRATPDSYPLLAVCANCGTQIVAPAGPEPWHHEADKQVRCDVRLRTSVGRV